MNQIFLVGRIYEPVTFKETAANIKMAQAVIAVKRSYQSSEGTDSDLYQVNFWRNNVDEVRDKFQVGDLVAIRGRLSANNFVKDTQEVIYRAEITGERISLID